MLPELQCSNNSFVDVYTAPKWDLFLLACSEQKNRPFGLVGLPELFTFHCTEFTAFTVRLPLKADGTWQRYKSHTAGKARLRDPKVSCMRRGDGSAEFCSELCRGLDEEDGKGQHQWNDLGGG